MSAPQTPPHYISCVSLRCLTDLASENFDGILRIPLQVSEMRRIGLAVGVHPSAAVQKFSAFVENWVDRQYR